MTNTSFDKVAQYYGSFNEWSRLESPAGRLEFARVTDLVQKHLPPPARVLDLGGGPGRYSLFMSWRGYRMALADLSPEQIAFARTKVKEHGFGDGIESMEVVNAIDLSRYQDASFDGVLSLGPFYHLVDAADRQKAAKEVARVTRKDGLIFVAFLPRLTGAAGLLDRAASHPEQVGEKTVDYALRTGVFHNAAGQGFQEGYFMPSSEIEALFAACGVRKVSIQSITGIATGREDSFWKIQSTNPRLFDRVCEALELTASEPSVVETCDHALFIGRLE